MLVELLIENYAVVEQLRVRFHSWHECADRAKPEWKVHCGGCAGSAVRGAGVGGNGPQRGRTGAAVGDIRAADGCWRSRRSWTMPASSRKTANCCLSGKFWLTVSSRAFAGSRPVTAADFARSVAVSRRYPRAARSAAAVRAGHAARDAGRICRGGGPAEKRRRASTAAGGVSRARLASWTGRRKISCGCWTCGVSSAKRSSRRG